MSNNELNECSICLSENNKLSINTACGHKFHKDCIELWLQTSSISCPICRTRINPEFINGGSDDLIYIPELVRGYSQENSLVFNRSAIDRSLFGAESLKRYFAFLNSKIDEDKFDIDTE